MDPGIGGRAFVSRLPDIAVDVARVITQLGDMWFLLVGITLVYGVSRREDSLTETPFQDCLYLFALAIGVHATALILKHAFALPRPAGATTAAPPEYLPLVGRDIFRTLVRSEGYGFPSAHTAQATVVYGEGVVILTAWKRAKQLVVAGLVVGLVALSRVVLRVHYLVDVFGGLLVGLLFLVIVVHLTDRDPARALLVAAVVGLGAVGVTLSYQTGLVVVGAVGGLLLWRPHRAEN